ncbi:hypothetical protein M3Y94_01232100 [Aphelenchoides besseyi]|nr:hypothetical protein M3Y94_01232100 [Aphelenchoides besseyi]KAI6219633.1 hypothetical protein M3Y95_01087400 [Aphelenchoides besseyi]
MLRVSSFGQMLSQISTELPPIDLTNDQVDEQDGCKSQEVNSRDEHRKPDGQSEGQDDDNQTQEVEEGEQETITDSSDCRPYDLMREMETVRDSLASMLEVMAHFGDAIVTMKTTLRDVRRDQRVILATLNKENSNNHTTTISSDSDD